MMTDSNDSHSANAEVEINVTLDGIVNVCKDEQFLKEEG